MVSWKPHSKLSCVCLPLEKLVNGKHFPVKRKSGLVFRKMFSLYFGRKTLSRSCEKIKNIILFANYNKFGPQTFDCYIFCFEFFFQFHPLEFDLIWFDLIFILTLVLIFMIVICFSLIIFLIKIFCISNLVLILLIVNYFIWNNLWNCNYYYFNLIIF
jgi:hypothetical protein